MCCKDLFLEDSIFLSFVYDMINDEVCKWQWQKGMNFSRWKVIAWEGGVVCVKAANRGKLEEKLIRKKILRLKKH